MSSMVDLTGIKSGKLTVLAPHGKDKFGRYTWFCVCECGNSAVIRSNNLRTGNSKSCGCEKYKIGKGVRDLRGEKFGKLTPIERDMERIDSGKVYWLCKCECGNVVSVWMGDLTTSHTKSCGCLLYNPDSKYIKRRKWSQAVREKYNYTCQKCGTTDGSMNAHHIKNYKDFSEVRYDVDNGACLCVSCHTAFHRRYGHRNSDVEEFTLWLKETE